MEGETVIAGVDTHKDVHVLCLLDGLGRKIWSGSFRADPEGYDRLAETIGDPGSCAVVGVEGTASYGAGLTSVSVNLFFTSFAKQARRLRKGGFTGCANVFSPIPVTARRGRPSAGPSACRTCRLS